MHDPPADDIMTSATESQLTSTVLMIRPTRFESNPQTAASNRFQGGTSETPDEQQAAALREFEGLVTADGYEQVERKYAVTMGADGCHVDGVVDTVALGRTE